MLQSKCSIFSSKERSEWEYSNFSTVMALCFILLCKTSKSHEGLMGVKLISAIAFQNDTKINPMLYIGFFFTCVMIK